MDIEKTETKLEEVVRRAGGQTSLATKIGVKPQAVQQWVAAKRIPAKRVIGVEAASGISRHELRPDIFGPPPQAATVQMDESPTTDDLTLPLFVGII